MPDRENVIKELQRLSNDLYADGRYSDSQTCQKAITLLKAQEPHVMTLEEYEAWVDIPFTERNPVFCEERTRRGSICYWANTTVYSRSEYGNNKRCWTSRPTDAQREATPWKSADK